jgi:hypothetical protein
VAAKKVSRYRKLLFFVNVPLMIGIPAFLESGVFLSYYEHKLQQITTLLTVADFFFVIDSLLIYSLIGKIVTSVAYKPEDNKLEITHLGTTFLKPKTELVDPQNLIKHRRKSINPLIGYK